jgi:hypothetical protein
LEWDFDIVGKILMSRIWWNLFGKIWIQNVLWEIFTFKWFLQLKIQANSKKTKFCKEKSIEDVVTLEFQRHTGHTSTRDRHNTCSRQVPKMFPKFTMCSLRRSRYTTRDTTQHWGLFDNFVMLPYWRSSTRGNNQIWL